MSLHKGRALEVYHAMLSRIAQHGASHEILRMHAESVLIPVKLASDPINEFATKQVLDELKPFFTEDLKEPMLQIIGEVAHKILADKATSNECRDEVAEWSLTAEERAAFVRTMRVVAEAYRPPKLVLFDAYGIGSDEDRHRQRDLAIIWDGFATTKWTDRIRKIKALLHEPKLRLVGVTQDEVDNNLIPGLTSRVRDRRYVANATPADAQNCSSCGARLL